MVSIVTRLLVVLALCGALGLQMGCSQDRIEANAEIAVEGVLLGMKDADVQTTLGGEGRVEPCVQGYERNYESPSVTVGFDQQKESVRRIVAKDSSQQIYGVSPGDGYEESRQVLVQAGFSPEGESRSKFLMDDLRIALTSFDETSVDAVTIELRTGED